jgi:signal transduction histidine kinase
MLPDYSIILISCFISFLILLTRFISRRENDQIKNEFINVVTHKFRTPLTTIKWITKSLKENIPYTEKEEYLKQLDQTNEKMTEMVDILVNFVKLDKRLEYAYKASSLREMIYGSLQKLSGEIREKNIHFTIDSMQDLPLIVLDEVKIQFVIDTLFNNAVKYTQNGGSVTVHVTNKDKTITLVVEDTGMGITSKDLRRIGNKFYRSKTALKVDTEGLGLAIYASKEIIKKHGGKLKISSKGENKGSKFTIEIPKN